MAPLSFDPEIDSATVFSHATKKYFEFYGLDLHKRLDCVTHCFGSFEAAGHRLACHYYTPAFPLATVYLVHGYLDHCGLFSQTIEFFLRNQFAVVIYDMPGHGLSSGRRFDLDNINTYSAVLQGLLRLTHKKLSSNWYAVGQGAGAACIINLLISKPLTPFNEVILLAPLIRIKRSPLLRLIDPLIAKYSKSVRNKLKSVSSNKEFLDFLKNRDPLQPKRLPLHWYKVMDAWAVKAKKQKKVPRSVMVIQGDCDVIVDSKYSARVIKKLFNLADIHTVHGAGHHLANEGAALRAKIFSLMKQHIGTINPYISVDE